MTVTYSGIPSAFQFRTDCAGASPQQKKSSSPLSKLPFLNKKAALKVQEVACHDPVLWHIEHSLEWFDDFAKSSTDENCLTKLCDLFLTCNFWIKEYNRLNPRQANARYHAVLALFVAVVAKLRVMLNCKNDSEVARKMELIFGRAMHEHGVQVDDEDKRAKYFSDAEREIYRIFFKAGRAYQFQWWGSKSYSEVICDSVHAYTLVRRRGSETGAGFGGFVMTVERTLYMAPHSVGQNFQNNGIFHSSYTSGSSVMMAGTMLIQQGKILAIRPDSGHYQPTETNFRNFLQSLCMFGVDLTQVRVLDFTGGDIGKAFEFLRNGWSWREITLQAKNEAEHRIGVDAYRSLNLLGKKHNGVKDLVPSVPKEKVTYE